MKAIYISHTFLEQIGGFQLIDDWSPWNAAMRPPVLVLLVMAWTWTRFNYGFSCSSETLGTGPETLGMNKPPVN